MVSQKELKQANYVHRGDDDSQYIEDLGQCGLPACDYSKFIQDNNSKNEYRYCVKLQMPVDCYDSCRYHSDAEWNSLINQWADSVQQENTAKTTPKPVRKKRNWIPILVILCLCIILFLYFNK